VPSSSGSVKHVGVSKPPDKRLDHVTPLIAGHPRRAGEHLGNVVVVEDTPGFRLPPRPVLVPFNDRPLPAGALVEDREDVAACDGRVYLRECARGGRKVPPCVVEGQFVNPLESWRASLCGLGLQGAGFRSFVVDG
jgi:hypothetical protein